MNKPAVISLFSGIGGIDVAFMNSGFEIVFANDADKFACTTYRNNFNTVSIVNDDIKNISENDIPKGEILVAGFPCQPFSVMGYQKGFRDSRGNLFFEILRIAEHIKPEVIFLENVNNLIYHDFGKTFITIHNSLANLGYFVKCKVLDAKIHGNIPQIRKRTFIAAFKKYATMQKFSFPDENPLTKSIGDIVNRNKKHTDVYYYTQESKYFNLLNQRIPDCTGIYRIDDSGVAVRKYDICPTLKANMGTYHDRVPIIRDNYGIRKLTPYECFAFQGFPADYKFKGIPLNEAYKETGNTVCVPVVERIDKKIFCAVN